MTISWTEIWEFGRATEQEKSFYCHAGDDDVAMREFESQELDVTSLIHFPSGRI